MSVIGSITFFKQVECRLNSLFLITYKYSYNQLNSYSLSETTLFYIFK